MANIKNWGQELSEREVTALGKSKHAAAIWPTKDDLKLLAQAVSKRKSKVLFADSRQFNIEYRANDKVFIWPAAKGSYVPCGYFDVDKLRGLLK